MDVRDLANVMNKCSEQLVDFAIESINQAGYELETAIKQRIFDENEDILGNKFSAYSTQWAKRRKIFGRDASKKNFKFTNSMLNGIEYKEDTQAVEFDSSTKVRKINSQKTYKRGGATFKYKPYKGKPTQDAVIGEGLERQENKKIFESSDSEVELALQIIDEVYNERINECFRAVK